MFRPAPPDDERELPPRFRFLGFEVDLPTARVRRDEETLPLEPRAVDLLLLLAANPGRMVGKEEILARLWGKAFVTDNALTRVVAHLRHALGDRADRPHVIETVRTRGYRFLPEIAAVELPAAAGDVPAAVGEGAERPASARRHAPWLGVGLGIALAAVVLVVAARLHDRDPERGTTPGLTLVQRTLEAGNQLFPRFSPDGSHLVYAGDEGGELELFITALDGGVPVQITRDGPSSEPAWSPDGRWIAYRNLSRGGLWLVPPTGGEARQLTDFGTQPAWSPDGRTVVFAHPGKPTLGVTEWPATYDSALWLVDVETGATRPLTEADPGVGGQGMPVFTPDGRWIVYATANHAEGGGLWRVRASGGRPEVLIPPGEAATAGEPPRRDPVGARRGALYHDPCPLPDGTGVYVVRAGLDFRILRVRWDGETEPVLSPAPAGTAHLALSRDGRRLALAVQRTETRIEEVGIAADGTSAAPPRALVASTTRRVRPLRYSPDGRWLLYTRYSEGSNPDLVVVDADGREPLVLADSVGSAVWTSPTELVIGAYGEALLVDVVTGRRRRWQTPPGAREVVALARPRPFVTRGDLRAIAFTRPRQGGRDLWVWEVDGGEPRRLTHLAGWVDYPAWSRDGGWIAFQHATQLALANELWRIPATGGAPERLPTGDGPTWGAAFAPDAERLVYAALREGRWHLAITGPGKPERLLAVPPETTGYLRWPDWSPDGRRIAYERMRYQTNLWTVDLPLAPGGG